MLKKLRQNSKFKALYIPVLITIILIAMLMFNSLKAETTLPDPDWSRAVPLPLNTLNSQPYEYQDTVGYHIYAKEGETVKHLVVDEGLELKNQSVIQANIPPLKPFWAKDNSLIYVKDGELILFNGIEEKNSYSGVNGMIAHDNLMLFWQNNKLFSVDETNFTINAIGESTYQIESVILNQDNPNNFIVVSNPDSSHIDLTLYQKEDTDAFKEIPLFTVTEYSGETISGFQYTGNEEELKILYTTYSIKQGEVTYRAYLTSTLLNNIEKEPIFENIDVYDESTSYELKNPKHIQITLRDDTPTLLLSAYGYISTKKSGVNIYEAKYTDDTWVASKRSKTTKMSLKPLWLDENNILWLDFLSSKEYALKGSSTDPNTVEESQKLTSDDWMIALTKTILALTVSLIIIFNSLLWIAPTALFVTVISFVNITLLERDVPWIKWTSIGMYVITQLFIAKGFFTTTFNTFAPSILTIPGNFIIIPLVLAVVTYFLTKLAKNNDWEMIHEISYFIIINVWLFTILIGPYIS